jgi:hypothetical protein
MSNQIVDVVFVLAFIVATFITLRHKLEEQ